MAEGLVRSSRKTPTKFDNGFEPTFDSDGAPSCLSWKIDDVADWVEFLGFQQYRACFKDNLINGRKLITVDASSLPRMGITDFEHIKVIAKKVRELLGIEEPYWNRSISLLHRESLGLFLEKKSNTGVEADLLTFEDYKRQLQRQEQSKQTKR
ncbi:sterile alpha motif domain-containing protein 15-like isoform X2 [Orbicella faveolata]|uniref:sterile alpha motif domain-containing protein 15-like isoform X1 n=1 Tax=Orbicella faveolata TaxID=48498 RepID=UPI0009E5AD34|nr:sterile alpha motif domain-containing protein 15-like isoform X1 [Orbicella faveolata]XP_020622468.1 sterile alpha motif domain-containing protein 15-like isoform X2 [Orbicella faveolata]